MSPRYKNIPAILKKIENGEDLTEDETIEASLYARFGYADSMSEGMAEILVEAVSGDQSPYTVGKKRPESERWEDKGLKHKLL